MKRIVIFGWLQFFVAGMLMFGCGPPSAPPSGSANSTSSVDDDGVLRRADMVLDLMRRRLSLMQDVARWKWNAAQPIHDPQREAELLQKLTEQAREAGLDVDFARKFFGAQMQAAKAIQQTNFDLWRGEEHQPFDDAPDLQTELRPKIGEISRRLVVELAALYAELSTPAVQEQIRNSRFDPEASTDENVWDLAIAPLLVNPTPPD